MVLPKKPRELISIEKRHASFNCPCCGSMDEIVKTFKNGTVILECANCHTDKEERSEKELSFLKEDTWRVRKPCSECGSKKRYGTIENGIEVTRCAYCDAIQ